MEHATDVIPDDILYDIRPMELLMVSCNQAVQLATKIETDNTALKAQWYEGVDALHEDIKKRNSSVEKLRSEIQVSKKAVEEVIIYVKTEHNKLFSEKEKLRHELEKATASLSKAQSDLAAANKKHETAIREANARAEAATVEKREVEEKIAAQQAAHDTQLDDLRAVAEQKEAKLAEELKRLTAQRTSAAANVTLLKILWQLTSNSVCIPSLLEVCPDVAKQLLEMLMQAFQRATELKEHILSIAGIFVNLAASPDSLPRLLEKHGPNSLPEFLVVHLFGHARHARNMQLYELSLNLADNLACDREGAKQLLEAKILVLIKDHMSWLKTIPLVDLALQLCARLMPYHHLSKQPSKELFWEILKMVEKDREKDKDKFKDSIWQMYSSYQTHFKEE